MKLTLLGTGDSTGTPKIGCDCEVCTLAIEDSSYSRTRFSILFENGKETILVDTSPDMRLQLIRAGVSSVSGVVWTHPHYDHFAGFGEFYRIQDNVEVYSIKPTLDYILNYLYFISHQRNEVELFTPFELCGIEFTLFDVHHPSFGISTGMRITDGDVDVVISGDTSAKIPEKSLRLMDSPDLLIADALGPPGFHINKHMNAEDAILLANKCRAEEVVLTHISHFYTLEEMDSYPLGHDGMELRV